MVGVSWCWLVVGNNISVLTQFIMITERENNSLISRKQTWPPPPGGDGDYQPVSVLVTGLDHRVEINQGKSGGRKSFLPAIR